MSLSGEVSEFLRIQMCIDVEELVKKFNDPAISSHSNVLYETVEYLRLSLTKTDPESEIERVLPADGLLPDDVVYIIDTLRLAFCAFFRGGLLELYTYQENEYWFPKITLTEILTPNDIGDLEDEVVIYRGCNVSEHESGKYGQAWSTSEEVANSFAFKLYQNAPWFNAQDRVVIKAVIPKVAILYSLQIKEYEVVVKTCCLISPRLVSTFNEALSAL